MQTTAHIDFQGCEVTDQLRDLIERQLASLEERFGRITAGRIVVKGPGEHHRTGGHYEVNVHLSLPGGREVSIERTPSLDERHADPLFAIADAFKRARRRLQDQVRRMRGQVKQHESPPLATVRQLDREKGFGFLETDDGREIYFHRNSVLQDAFVRLKLGARVSFAEEIGDKGPQASTVRLLQSHALR
jgi:cold shock CspA family protein